MKDYLVYHMMNDMGVAAPLSSFVQISVNGESFGLYLAVEGIEEAFIQRNYGELGGNLYKPDSFSQEDMAGRQQMGQDSSAALLYTDDDLDSYNTIWNGAIFDYSRSDQERLVESLRQLNNGENLEKVVDVESVLRYFAVHNFVVSFDSYTGTMMHNYYLYEKDGQLTMLPWDYNLAFGGFSGGMGGQDDNSAQSLVNYPIDTPVSGTSLEDRPILGQLLAVPEYLELYHQYLDAFIRDYFESGYFSQMMDQVIALISPYVQADPTAFYSYEEFQNGSQTLKAFCLLRAESVRGQLEGDIPSTEEGQQADAENLVEVDDLNISAMGDMGGGMPRTPNMQQNQDGQSTLSEEDAANPFTALPNEERPDFSAELPAGETPDSSTEPPEGETPDFPADGAAGRGGMGGGFPGMETNAANATRRQEWILLGASVLLLILGILFVRRFRY